MRSSRLLSMLAVLLLACAGPALAIGNDVVLAPATAAKLLEVSTRPLVDAAPVAKSIGVVSTELVVAPNA